MMKQLQKPTIDPKVRRFRSALRVFENCLNRASRIEETCCGVTLPQCHALLALSESKTVSLKELTARLNLDKSTLSRTIDSLAENGLADRRTRPGDRRVCCISLTARGRSAVNRIHRKWDGFAEAVLDRVPETGRDRALEGLETLARAFADAIGGAPPSSACCGETGND